MKRSIPTRTGPDRRIRGSAPPGEEQFRDEVADACDDRPRGEGRVMTASPNALSMTHPAACMESPIKTASSAPRMPRTTA